MLLLFHFFPPIFKCFPHPTWCQTCLSWHWLEKKPEGIMSVLQGARFWLWCRCWGGVWKACVGWCSPTSGENLQDWSVQGASTCHYGKGRKCVQEKETASCKTSIRWWISLPDFLLICPLFSLTGTWDASPGTRTVPCPIYRPLLPWHGQQGHQTGACAGQLHPRHDATPHRPVLHHHPGPHWRHHHLQWQPGKRDWTSWHLQCSCQNGIQTGRYPDGRYPLPRGSDWPTTLLRVSWGVKDE